MKGHKLHEIIELFLLQIRSTHGPSTEDVKNLVARTRKLFSQIAVGKLGYSGAKVARFLGVTTSCVNRLAASEEVPEISGYL